MSDRTGIEWTDASWNPIRGCSRVSEGCRNCYAESVAARFSRPGRPFEGFATTRNGEPHWTGKVELMPHLLELPLRWKEPRRIFVNSMSDLFHEALPDEAIDQVFAVMDRCERHTFQILTKRPERMREYMKLGRDLIVGDTITGQLVGRIPVGTDIRLLVDEWPLPNVWLGVSVENQDAADERIPALLATPAAVRFISAEPLLGPIELRGARGLDWAIVGGESGKGHRAMDPEWLSSLACQCAAYDVPLFVKQDSGHRPGLQGRISDDLWAKKEFPS